MHLHHVLNRTLDDPDATAALMGALGSGTGAHVDEEQIAALLEGESDPRALAHTLDCARCGDLFDAAAAVVSIDSLPVRRPDPLAVAAGPPTLFADLRVGPDGALDVTSYSGSLRVQPALTVRGGRSTASLTLRDRSPGSALEIGVIADPGEDRVSLLVRWLIGSRSPDRARAVTDGRVVADNELRDGSALLAGLRRTDVRVDVMHRGEVIAIGWLRMATS